MAYVEEVDMEEVTNFKEWPPPLSFGEDVYRDIFFKAEQFWPFTPLYSTGLCLCVQWNAGKYGVPLGKNGVLLGKAR